MPASSDHELSLYPGWMKWVILCDRERLVRHTVHIESHTWEFHVKDKVVPVLVADLAKAKKA